MKRTIIIITLLQLIFSVSVNSEGLYKLLDFGQEISRVVSYSWSPTGEYIAYCQTDRGRISLLDLKTKTTTFLLDGFDPIWLNNEEILTSRYTKYNIKTHQKSKFVKNHLIEAIDMAFAPNQKRFAHIELLGTKDLGYNVLVLTEIDRNSVGKEYVVYVVNTGGINIIGWLDDDKILINDYFGGLKVINANTIQKYDITSKRVKEYLPILTKMCNKKISFTSVSYKEVAEKIKGNIFSYDGKFLVTEELKPGCIFDINTVENGKTVYIIKMSSGEGSKWSPASNLLAYIEHFEDKKGILRVVDLNGLK